MTKVKIAHDALLKMQAREAALTGVVAEMLVLMRGSTWAQGPTYVELTRRAETALGNPDVTAFLELASAHDRNEVLAKQNRKWAERFTALYQRFDRLLDALEQPSELPPSVAGADIDHQHTLSTISELSMGLNLLATDLRGVNHAMVVAPNDPARVNHLAELASRAGRLQREFNKFSRTTIRLMEEAKKQPVAKEETDADGQ